MTGLLIAAPSSGAGKTTVTLALIAALVRSGVSVASAKAGPDYIDPAFHAAASGRSCVNLDPWAMRADLIGDLAATASSGAQAFLVEGMMGLFDGAADGTGSAADLAESLDLNVVLVVDCAKQSHSVAALVSGFATYRSELPLAGVILNRVGSSRHEMLLREALAPLGIPVLAALPRRSDLVLPERHLGLVQAGEHRDLDRFLFQAADWMASNADLEALARLASPQPTRKRVGIPGLAPLGQHIAVARDEAFAFAYPHCLDGWRRMGAELSFFSPLADEAPAKAADAIYLPGGYPELHGERLAAAGAFRSGMSASARRGVSIYGECGGYMVLGDGIIDKDGHRHDMLGLLPLVTSFKSRKLHLGYRRIWPSSGAPFMEPMTGHEFHYATVLEKGSSRPLFESEDARGQSLGSCGHIEGNVCGSFLHLIDRVEP